MHDYFPFAVTIAVILIGILLNHRDLERLEDRMEKRFDSTEKRFDSVGSRFDRIENRLDRIEADLRQFYQTLGDHSARIENLEKGRSK